MNDPTSPSDTSSGTSLTSAGDTPGALRLVVGLLVVNLALSITLTLLTLAFRHQVVDYQLDHRHITGQAERESLRHSYTDGIVGRVVGNVLVSIVYAFLVRALLRGRRWAYRRVIVVSIAGIVGLLLLQVTPYPSWMRAEQLAQAIVLAALLITVTRPTVRAYFDSSLPGRTVGRFRQH